MFAKRNASLVQNVDSALAQSAILHAKLPVPPAMALAEHVAFKMSDLFCSGYLCFAFSVCRLAFFWVSFHKILFVFLSFPLWLLPCSLFILFIFICILFYFILRVLMPLLVCHFLCSHLMLIRYCNETLLSSMCMVRVYFRHFPMNVSLYSDSPNIHTAFSASVGALSFFSSSFAFYVGFFFLSFQFSFSALFDVLLTRSPMLCHIPYSIASHVKWKSKHTHTMLPSKWKTWRTHPHQEYESLPHPTVMGSWRRRRTNQHQTFISRHIRFAQLRAQLCICCVCVCVMVRRFFLFGGQPSARSTFSIE